MIVGQRARAQQGPPPAIDCLIGVFSTGQTPNKTFKLVGFDVAEAVGRRVF